MAIATISKRVVGTIEAMSDARWALIYPGPMFSVRRLNVNVASWDCAARNGSRAAKSRRYAAMRATGGISHFFGAAGHIRIGRLLSKLAV
jgi:hypothetical protein